MPDNSFTCNWQRSGKHDCHMHNQGVVGVALNQRLFLRRRNHCGHGIVQSEAGSIRSATIALVDLATALELLDGQACDQPALDCEGADYEILGSCHLRRLCASASSSSKRRPNYTIPANLPVWSKERVQGGASLNGLWLAQR